MGWCREWMAKRNRLNISVWFWVMYITYCFRLNCAGEFHHRLIIYIWYNIFASDSFHKWWSSICFSFLIFMLTLVSSRWNFRSSWFFLFASYNMEFQILAKDIVRCILSFYNIVDLTQEAHHLWSLIQQYLAKNTTLRSVTSISCTEIWKVRHKDNVQ